MKHIVIILLILLAWGGVDYLTQVKARRYGGVYYWRTYSYLKKGSDGQYHTVVTIRIRPSGIPEVSTGNGVL